MDVGWWLTGIGDIQVWFLTKVTIHLFSIAGLLLFSVSLGQRCLWTACLPMKHYLCTFWCIFIYLHFVMSTEGSKRGTGRWHSLEIASWLRDPDVHRKPIVAHIFRKLASNAVEWRTECCIGGWWSTSYSAAVPSKLRRQRQVIKSALKANNVIIIRQVWILVGSIWNGQSKWVSVWWEGRSQHVVYFKVRSYQVKVHRISCMSAT